MHQNKYKSFGWVAVIGCIIIFSCSKVDDTYKDFIQEGEIVYTAKVDSATPYPGNYRMDLSMLLISDPKISKVRVFWNTGLQPDSTEKEVHRTTDVDTVRFSFKNM